MLHFHFFEVRFNAKSTRPVTSKWFFFGGELIEPFFRDATWRLDICVFLVRRTDWRPATTYSVLNP